MYLILPKSTTFKDLYAFVTTLNKEEKDFFFDLYLQNLGDSFSWDFSAEFNKMLFRKSEIKLKDFFLQKTRHWDDRNFMKVEFWTTIE